jgi:tetratricopeptide (TPR) repeat protein
VVSNATAWIGARTGPFFAWVHIYEPHAPYAPPEDMAKAHPGQLYDAEVATADRCLGKLIEAAQAARPDRLVTAVTSDHGEGLGDHGESTHGLFVYQSTLDVPMVIAGAGVPRGKRTGALARSVDLAPTLLALLGAPGLTGVDGKNLAKGGGAGEAYAETDYPTGFGWAPLRSWRLGDLKLIEAPEVELYDLARDPKEERNLALTRATETARLRAVLKSALAGEVQKDQRRLNSEGEERLRSLGYVAGAAPTPGESTSALDPKAALPLFRDFERAMESEARGDLTTSALLLRALTRSDPGNVAFQRSLGSVLRRSGRAGESARLLTEAQRLTPKDAAIAHDRAMALQEMGRSEQAIEAEERATMLDPGFADAFEHLATLYALRGDFARARDAVDRAIALDGNSAWAWSNRGNIARAQKQTDDAERSYRRAIELSPDVVDAVNGLGVLAVERGDLEEAARRFSRALELAPALDEARLNLAVVESQRGHLERAVALATETAKAARDPALKAKAGAFLRDLGRSGR